MGWYSGSGYCLPINSLFLNNKGKYEMKAINVEALTAGIPLLIAGVIFAILQLWLYTGLL